MAGRITPVGVSVDGSRLTENLPRGKRVNLRGKAMSDSVVISKELRDKIQDIFSSFEMSDSMRNCFDLLRAAPESVNLEGVKTFVIKDGVCNSHILNGFFAEVSDLRHLVTPVQSVGVDLNGALSWVGYLESAIERRDKKARNHALGRIKSILTTTQSAPSINATRDQLSDLIDGLQNDEKWCNPDVMADCILTKYGVTTQSAPSVPKCAEV